MKHRVLLVDDDAALRRVLGLLLEDAGNAVELAGTVAAGRKALGAGEFDFVVTDLRLPDGDGLDVLKAAKEADPGLPVLVITAHGGVPSAVAAMKLGAFDYLEKPFDNDHFLGLTANALRLRDLARENVRLRGEVEQRFGLAAIIGSSRAMDEVRNQVRLAAASDAAVMVVGETGTGKELVARAVHLSSARARRPFVTINCGAIPESLVESVLFGHKRGSFTGAVRDHDGRFTMADTGTIFLDEVTEMPRESQVKLLRAIEAKEVQPVGATEPHSVDVRVISATNREPRECVAAGEFREDLFYRLNVFVLRLPALRERRGDIPELVAHYLVRRDLPVETVGRDVLALLAEHGFPGNVRELQNVLESSLIMSQGREIKPEHVAGRLMPDREPELPQIPDQGVSLAEVERGYLVEVLRKAGGNQSKAARLLGISRATLIYRLKKHSIDPAAL